MLKHHLTKYKTDGELYVATWLQLNLLGKCYCFSKKQIRITKI